MIRRTSSAADLTTDAYGRFVIAKPTRGATLDISAPGHQDSTLTIGKDNVSDIYLSPTVLEGAVLDAYTRSPVSATVKAGQVAGQADAQGRFRLSRVVPAKGQVSADGYAPAEFEYSGQAREVVALRPNTLTGRVTDARTGEGIAGARVSANGKDVTADAKGYYKLANVPEALSVTVSAPGYDKQSAEVQRQTKADFKLAAFEVRGLYVSFFAVAHDGLWGGIKEKLTTTEANAVVIDVKGDRGYIAYKSQVPLALQVGANETTTINNVDALMSDLKKNAIYTIARIVVFKDNRLGRNRPDLAVKSSATGGLWIDGEGLAWVDPFREEVWDYNIAIAKEAVRNGFDEVQFDYIRFPTDPQAGSSVGAAVFSRPSTQVNRLQAIEGFLARASAEIRGMGAKLSVDTFGYTTWRDDDMGIGQRIENIAKYVDYISPMVYPSTYSDGLPMVPSYADAVAYPYEIVFYSLEKAQKRLAGTGARLRAWLQYYDDYPWASGRPYREREVNAQKKAAADAGTPGWLLWDPFVRYDKGGLAPKGR